MLNKFGALTFKLRLVLAVLIINAMTNFYSMLIYLGGQNFHSVLVHLLTAALYLGPAYGLYQQRNWARLLQITFSLIFVAHGMILMIGTNMLAGMLNIVTYGLIALYLLSDECRNQFKHIVD